MATWQKYALFQVPGWLVAAVILLGLIEWISLSPWAASGLFTLWVIKDIAMYPLVRTAYQSRVKTGVEQLVGEKGVVQSPLGPRGMVRVRGELWQAEIESAEAESSEPQRIERNSTIKVTAGRGLTLIVAKEATNRSEGTIAKAMLNDPTAKHSQLHSGGRTFSDRHGQLGEQSAGTLAEIQKPLRTGLSKNPITQISSTATRIAPS